MRVGADGSTTQEQLERAIERKRERRIERKRDGEHIVLLRFAVPRLLSTMRG